MEFFAVMAALKDTPRRGWEQRGVPSPESVSDHMYQMAQICLVYPWDNERERARAIEMALVHDAPEVIAGDVTPSDGVSKDHKRQREELGCDFLACVLANGGHPGSADRLRGIWQEYEQHESHVSKVVHQIDKLDALLQAFYYTRQYPGLEPSPRYPKLRLSDFRAKEILDQINDPHLKLIRDTILHKWNAYESQRLPRFILVVGGPGVGKGTQCAEAAAKKGFAHISVGDLLRQEQADPNSHFREFISKSFKAKVPVPPELAMVLLNRECDSDRIRGKQVILLDGFPRSVPQLEAFEQQITNEYSTIIMECSGDNLLQRLTVRAKSSGRQDDDPAELSIRIDKALKSDEPVWKRLAARPTTHTIPCDGSVTEVAAQFARCVDEIVGGGTSNRSSG